MLDTVFVLLSSWSAPQFSQKTDDHLGWLSMKELSFNQKRTILGSVSCLCLLYVANYYLNLGIAGRFGKQAVVTSFIVLALILHFVGPSVSEIREYRDGKRQKGKREL